MNHIRTLLDTWKDWKECSVCGDMCDPSFVNSHICHSCNDEINDVIAEADNW